MMARSKPLRDRPWYHILMGMADHINCAAELNLRPNRLLILINHTVVNLFKTLRMTDMFYNQIATYKDHGAL